MISILREDNQQAVWVKVEALGDLPPLWFRRESASALECRLLCERLRQELGTRLEEIRRVSYERGWKDAKAKRPRSTVFPTCTKVLDWEHK